MNTPPLPPPPPRCTARPGLATAFAVALLAAACRPAKPGGQPAPAAAPSTAAVARDSMDMPDMQHMDMSHNMGHGAPAMPGMDMPVAIPAGALYTEADVRFMQGMIAHHAQAIYMSRLAASHAASAHLLKFAQKIDQSQIVEIRLMQGWLRSNNQVAPDTSSWRHMSMPGMLTADQLEKLDAARGAAFDRLFLTFMIQHHRGALSMVKDLFENPRAGQDVDVSVFANDVQTVQTAEIATMYRMLDALESSTHR